MIIHYTLKGITNEKLNSVILQLAELDLEKTLVTYAKKISRKNSRRAREKRRGRIYEQQSTMERWIEGN